MAVKLPEPVLQALNLTGERQPYPGWTSRERDRFPFSVSDLAMLRSSRTQPTAIFELAAEFKRDPPEEVKFDPGGPKPGQLGNSDALKRECLTFTF